MNNEREEQIRELEQIQAVRMDNLEEDTLNFENASGTAPLTSAVQKKDKNASLLQQLHEVNEFLKRLDAHLEELQAIIDDLNRQRAEALAASQEAFDQMHEAEDLIADIQDGISDDERIRLIELLGDEAQNASIEELTLLLHFHYDRERQQGLDRLKEAEQLEKEIQEQQAIRDQLLEDRNNYALAENPRIKQGIEDRLSPLLETDEPRSSQSAEQLNQQYESKLSDDVNFNVPGF